MNLSDTHMEQLAEKGNPALLYELTLENTRSTRNSAVIAPTQTIRNFGEHSSSALLNHLATLGDS